MIVEPLCEEKLTFQITPWERPKGGGPMFATITPNVPSYPFAMRVEAYDDTSEAGREKLILEAVTNLRERLLNIRDELVELTR